MIFVYFALPAIVYGSIAVDIGLTDLFPVSATLNKILVKSVLDVIPTPEEFLDFGKQAIAGYPFEIASNIINEICSSAVSSNNIRPKVSPEASKLKFVLIENNGDRISMPVLEPDRIFGHPLFNRSKPLTIFVTGWLSEINSTNSALEALTRAYIHRGSHNFVTVDTDQFLNTFYAWSAFNTDAVGATIGESLARAIEYIPLDGIHLIGHSLGSHIVGAAGREFYEMTGKFIPRITGLDPAKPCFNEGEVLSGLGRGDAEFVDVIHSNSGVLGKRDPLGDADFYPGGLGPLPPCCFDVGCAHSRSWEFYAETVYPGNEMNFKGKSCNSLRRLTASKCNGAQVIMGYAVTRTKGNFFLDVNSSSPYGINAND